MEVEVFEWPDRFLVHPSSKDDEWPRFYPEFEDLDPYAPYLVDLSECEEGWCGCRDFYVNVLPFLGDAGMKRTKCKHIIACEIYKSKLSEPPKKLPASISF